MAYIPGTTVTLTFAPLTPATDVYAYCWLFWDGTRETTSVPTIQKRISTGGNPSDSGHLGYTCTPVTVDGQSADHAGYITAYNEADVYDVTVSKNDDYYGYATTLSFKACSLEGQSLTFEWMEGTTSLSTPTVAAGSNVSRTWHGTTATVSVPVYAPTYVVASVLSDRVIKCKVTNGTASPVVSYVEFNLRGKAVPPLGVYLATDTGAVTTDATSGPVARIGVGQTITFKAYVRDIDNISPTFSWEFSGANGWTATGTEAGVTVNHMDDGIWECIKIRDISGEAVPYGPAKTVKVLCNVAGGVGSRSVGKTTVIPFTAVLLKNNPPSFTHIVCKRTDGSIVDMGLGVFDAGTKLIYEATSDGVDLDVVTQAWTFTGHTYPATLYSYGPKVVIDTTGYASGARVQCQLTSTDSLGGSLTRSFVGPKIT